MSRTLFDVSVSVALLLGGLVGVLLGAVAVVAFRVSERAQHTVPPQEPAVPPDVDAVLSVLGSSSLVIDGDDVVRKASAPAHSLGLVHGDRLAVDSLLDVVHQVRRDGQIRESELTLATGSSPGRRVDSHVVARVAPLGRLVLVLIEDRTRERRVEAIRRDFVANVSHELKTPVGALRLLSDTIIEAADDPDAVRRFGSRMQTESERLGRLVHQIIELSRLQGDDPVDTAAPVDVDDLIAVALDRAQVGAAERGVEVRRAGVRGVQVLGHRGQLELALGNLVENAVTHGASGTHVVVTAALADGGGLELAVSDHGAGIPQAELGRIFERFYRVDPARARTTGGTGLGLSIVKHVVASHGGEIRVWSEQGEGSTFTLCLPGVVRVGGRQSTLDDPSAQPSATETDALVEGASS